MSEVRAAAERLRDLPLWYGTQNSISIDGFDYEWLLKIRDAYLAEHAADDDEPLTREWLGSIGGHLEWHPSKVTFRREDALNLGLWSVGDGWKVMCLIAEHSASCVVRGLKTRGDFRRLAAALHIPLRSPECSERTSQ